MKSFLLLLTLCFSIVAYGQKQKITLDEDTIRVNGAAYAILEKSSGMSYNFTIKSMSGKELMYLQFLEFNNKNKVQASNPQGRVTYYEATFFNDKQKCEVVASGGQKSVAKMIAENNLISGESINQDAENKFVLINGMKFSEEKKATSGTTIIINP